LKFQIIILILISLLWQIGIGQDLEEISPKPNRPKQTHVMELQLPKISNEVLATDQIEESALERASNTYKKEEYLNAIIRQQYYQTITTNHWSKYFNEDSWKRNVQKWRYWTQLRNYLSGNDKNVLVIRTPESMPIEEEIARIDPDRFKLDDSILPENYRDTAQEGTNLDETLALMNRDSLFEWETDNQDLVIAQYSETKNDEVILKDKSNTELEIKEKQPEIKETTLKAVKKSNIESTPPKVQDPIMENTEVRTTATEPTAVQTPVHSNTGSTPATSSRVAFPRVTPANFYAMKGRLPWPVQSGRVTDRFGIRQNAEARGLRPENYGIDMVCPGSTIVRAISDGTVLLARRQSPYDYIVTIKHGQFTTAYYFLITPYVKAGDQIVAGQNIGQLRTSVQEADFHFEIWQNQDRINPELWLKKR